MARLYHRKEDRIGPDGILARHRAGDIHEFQNAKLRKSEDTAIRCCLKPSRSCIQQRSPSSPARPPDAHGKCARPAHQRQNNGWVFGRIGAAGLRTQGKRGDEQQGKCSVEQDSLWVHGASLSVLVSSKVMRINVIGAGLRIIVICRGLRLVAIAVLHGDLPVVIVSGVQAACRRAAAAGGIDAPGDLPACGSRLCLAKGEAV